MADQAERNNGDGPGEKDWVCVGAIAGARGVKGEVRIRSLTTEPRDIASFPQLHDGPGGAPIRLSLIGMARGMLTARIDGVTDRDAAEALKGTELYVPRADLPVPGEGEFYARDLTGLIALDGAGQRLGVVQGVEDFGAGPIIELTLDQPKKNVGRSLVLPFTLALVPGVDIANGTVTVLLSDWLHEQDLEQDEPD